MEDFTKKHLQDVCRVTSLALITHPVF